MVELKGFSIIGELLLKRLKINRFELLKEFLILVVIFTIIISFSMLLIVYQHYKIAVYEDSNYDLIIRGFSSKQIDEINNLNFVDKIYPVRMFEPAIICKGEKTFNDVSLYMGDSFTNKNISYFSDKLIIEQDKSLLFDKKINPIVLDYTIAKELSVSIGDSVNVPFGKNRDAIVFKVAAIYEPLNGSGRPMALGLWQGKQKEIYLNDFKTSPPYSVMFIKTKNIKRALDYFENSYVMMGDIELKFGYGLSKEQIDEISKDFKGNAIMRQDLLDEVISSLDYTPPIILLTSILGFVIFILVLFRENNKKLILQEKKFSILYVLGCPKFYFGIYFILEMLLLQVPILALSAVFVKLIYYFVIKDMYLPLYILKTCLGFALCIQIVASIISGIIIYFKIKRKNLALILASSSNCR